MLWAGTVASANGSKVVEVGKGKEVATNLNRKGTSCLCKHLTYLDRYMHLRLVFV